MSGSVLYLEYLTAPDGPDNLVGLGIHEGESQPYSRQGASQASGDWKCRRACQDVPVRYWLSSGTDEAICQERNHSSTKRLVAAAVAFS